MDSRNGQGSASSAIWYKSFDKGKVVLPAGKYTVVDSDPKTWSNNAKSGNAGFFGIKWEPYDDIPSQIYYPPKPLVPVKSTAASTISAQNLGDEWTSIEGPWKGHWSRIPGTNTFNVVFTKGGDYVEDTFEIKSVNGNTVTLHRNKLNEDWVGTYSNGEIYFKSDRIIKIVK